MSTSISATSDLTPLWTEALNIFILDHPKLSSLTDSTTLSQTLSTLQNAKTRAAKAYAGSKLSVMGKSIEIKIDRILKRLQMFLDFGDLAIKAGPETVSVVWSAFRMVFSIFLSDLELCDFLTDAVDDISDVLFVCEVHGLRHLKKNRESVLNEVEVLQDKVLDKIPVIYALVLEFSYAVREHIAQKKFVRTITAWYKNLTKELSGILEKIKSKRDELHRTADIAFKAAALELLQGVRGNTQSLHEIRAWLDSTLLSAVDEVGKDVRQLAARSDKKETEKEYERQLKWLRAGNPSAFPERMKTEALKRRQTGTAEWIFKEEVYKQWHDSKGSKTLWVSAEPGFGKSITVASILESLEKEVEEAETSTDVALVYFFCKTGSEDTTNSRNILIHFLYQLYVKSDDEQKLRDKCMDAFKSAVMDRKTRTENATDLSSKELHSWFEAVVQLFDRRIYIVVDGLDECADFSDGFLGALQHLGGAADESDIHVLIASRPESNIIEEMHAIPTITMDKSKTDLDIQRYLFLELSKIKRLRQDERKLAFSVIKNKADGMFRYANLALDSLQGVKALKTPFKKFMNEFPDAMEGFYKEKLLALSPELRELLLLALRWQVCGGGGITAAQVAEDFQGVFTEEVDVERGEDLFDCIHTPEFSSENIDDTSGDDLWAQLSAETENDVDAVPLHETVDEETIVLQDSVDRLKSVSGEFIAIRAGDILDIRHKSVQDFVLSDASHLELTRQKTFCPQCLERLRLSSTYEAAPKHGHLLLALTIFKHLNSTTFQKKHLLIEDFDGTISEREDDWNDEDEDDESDDSSYDGSETDGGSDYSSDSDDDSSSSEDDEDDEDDRLPLRYELTHWHHHLREADKAWPKEERDEQWDELWVLVDSFLVADSLSYKCWQKRAFPKRPFSTTFDHPLHTAATYAITELLERQLTQPDMDVNIPDDDKCTPLHLACTYTSDGHDRLPSIKLLVKNGADINAKDCEEMTSLVTLAQSDGSTEAVKLLLKHSADPTIPDENKRTCLHYAAGNARLDMCEVLLDHGADVKAEDSDGETPLHWLLHNSGAQPELVQLLIKHGVDVNAQDHNSQAPLYEACWTKNTPAARILLDSGADVNDKEDVFGSTAVITACEKGSLELVELLVENGADIQETDKQGRDPLTMAAFNGFIAIVRFLLEKLVAQGVDIGQYLLKTDVQSQTPLHRSAARGRKEIVELLLSTAPDPIALCKAVNQKSTTPLHSAAKRGRIDIVKILIDHGADPLAKNSDDMTPFDLCEDEWQAAPEEDLSRYEETVWYLMDFDSESAKRLTLFRTAVERGSKRICERLLQLGMDPNEADEYGWSPLVLALHLHQEEIITLFRGYDKQKLEDQFRTELALKIGLPPTRWESRGEDEYDFVITVSEDGMELTSSEEDIDNTGAAITDNPAPAGTGVFYYEITVLDISEEDPIIGLGFTNPYANLDEMPGFCSEYGATWGFHGDDGYKYTYEDLSEKGELWGPLWGKGDTVGCGLDSARDCIFYTKNGEFLGTAFNNVRGRLYPVVGMTTQVKVRANFGDDAEKPFSYDMRNYEDNRVQPSV